MPTLRKPFVVLLTGSLLLSGVGALGTAKYAGAATAKATVTGTVFVDQNGNGLRDPREPGLNHVLVSDGVTVVATDGQGKYTLPVDTEAYVNPLVFVTVPTGYQKADSHYQMMNVAPGQSGTADFALRRAPGTDDPNFSFIVQADVHVVNQDRRDAWKRQIAQVNQVTGNPAFIVIAGDLTDYATDDEFKYFMEGRATSALPVWNEPGNHDHMPGDTYKSRIKRYRDYLGPQYYSFDYGSRHFVFLDSSNALTQPHQYEWLKQDLAFQPTEKEIVVIIHHPMATPQASNGSQAFIDLFKAHNVRLVLSGHTHVNDVQTDVIPGAKYVTTNSSRYTIDQTPWGFRVVSFQGGKLAVPFKTYDVDHSLAIVNPAPGAKVSGSSVPVLVNAYNTSSSVTRAEYSLDGNNWRKLSASSHSTWYSTLTAGRDRLTPGEHTVTVRVTDDASQSWTATSAFTVSAEPAPSVQLGADWSQFHGNVTHTGAATDVLTPPLSFAWAYRTGGTILTSSPSVVDGMAYVGLRDENDVQQNGIVAVNATTGRERWRYRTEGQVQASPAVMDGVVYAPSIHGMLYAIDARSGEKLWEKRLAGTDFRRGWAYFTPAAAGGVVYQPYSNGSGARVAAINGKDGSVIWDQPAGSNWIAHSAPAVADGKLFVGTQGGAIYAFNAADGTKLWDNVAAKKQLGGWMNSSLTYANGLIYVGIQGQKLFAIDANDGHEVWQYQSTDESFIPSATAGSTAAVSGGTVYMGFPDGGVRAFDALTGAVRWTYKTGGGVISSPVISGDYVYVGSNDGFLYGLGRQSGQVVWKHQIGMWVASSAAVSGNSLFIGAYDGNLYGFTSAK